MNLLPKTHEEFSKIEYWNSFFEKRGKKSFDWYGEYAELCGVLLKYMKITDDILVVGCGNSTLSMSLYDTGFRNITNIDLSEVVIRQMQDVNKTLRPNLLYEQMDATQMTYPDEKFSVVLDKSTLDALMPDTKEETISIVDKYLQEVTRVLRNGGRYICVSLLQEHVLKKLLSYFPTAGFMCRIVRCQEAEVKAKEEEGFLFPIFTIVATKFRKLIEPILEVALFEGHAERLSTAEELAAMVLGYQEFVFVSNNHRKQHVDGVGEISLDLYRPGDEHPRYSVYILDQPRVRKERTYAAFLVPTGREADWLFSTKEGRQQVLNSTNRDRLALVTVRREYAVEGWDKIKNELKDCIRNFAPTRLSANRDIPFLSLATDANERHTCYEGKSNISGAFVVEEVQVDGCEFRRLVFLDNSYVIQSEARLKQVKSRRGKIRKVIDPAYLACKHHLYMSVAVQAVLNTDNTAEVMIVGLGGGGLCTFLCHCFSKVKITVVEIDEAILQVAVKYFGLVLSDRMKVQVTDGIQFILDAARNGKQYNAILLDVDSKDTTLGLSCPPKQFLDLTVLKAVVQCLTKDGLFVLNLVCRDLAIKQKTKDDLNSVFASTACYKMPDEVNEIIVGSVRTIDVTTLKNKLKVAALSTKQKVSEQRLSVSQGEFDVPALFENLCIN